MKNGEKLTPADRNKIWDGAVEQVRNIGKTGWDGRVAVTEATGPNITVDGVTYKLLGKDVNGSPVYQDVEVLKEQTTESQTNQETQSEQEVHEDWLKSIGAESTALNALDKYMSAEYHRTAEYGILDGYRRAVEKGDISPLVGLRQYKIVASAVDSNIVGETTSTNVQIEGYVSHFVDRVIGQSADAHSGMRQGVSIQDALDAIQNPVAPPITKVMADGDVRQTFIGENAKVTISLRDKILIQTNPR